MSNLVMNRGQSVQIASFEVTYSLSLCERLSVVVAFY